jgi:pimeloyl-ACP methyl ester carboxylesterase
MKDLSKIDYSHLDRPDILGYLFHPRPVGQGKNSSDDDHLIPVEKNVVVGARFHLAKKSSPNILFFHGNGEIVSDYDDLGHIYNERGINFLPVDYRGYGRSTGTPTMTTMIRDAHIIFQYSQKWLADNIYTGHLIVMGRSLGSASALELASSYPSAMDGLIIESGFAHDAPLLRLLGIDVDDMGITEASGFQNKDKIRQFEKPTLIIHAQHDHIIPIRDGRTLYEACPSKDKELLIIPDANHNDIFQWGLSEYLTAIETLLKKITIH